MSDYPNDAANQLIAVAAIASTDSNKFSSVDDWQRAVIKRATSIQRLGFFKEDGLLMSTLGAIRITAKIVSVDYEESSKRYVITFIAENNQDGKSETIRTARTDSWRSAIVMRDIERLKEYAGTDKRVVIFKSNEKLSEEQMEKARRAGQNVPPQGFRNACWFEFLD